MLRETDIPTDGRTCATQYALLFQRGHKKYFQKLQRDVPNVPKQAEVKRTGVINPQNNNFKQFQHEKKLMFSNATNQPWSTVEFGYMCPRGLTGPPAVTPTK